MHFYLLIRLFFGGGHSPLHTAAKPPLWHSGPYTH